MIYNHRTALYHPGDRQGPGHIEITLATIYDVFSHPGASETVKGDLLQLPKAAMMVKVKAKAKKSQGQKLKCLKWHEMQEFAIKKIPHTNHSCGLRFWP